MTGSIEQADRQRKARAAIHAAGACALLLTGLLSAARDDGGDRYWLIMAAGLALWLTPVMSWLGRRRPLTRLLEDELTQQHRARSYVAGFWAAIGSAAVIAALGPGVDLTLADATRLIVTAGLAAALGGFAIQEWLEDA